MSSPPETSQPETTQIVSRFAIDRVAMEADLVDEAIRENRFDDAISLCETFMQKNPEDAKEMNPVYSRALYSKAIHLPANQAAQAGNLLRRSVAADPQNVQAWFKQGLLLVNTGKFKDSLECFQTVTRHKPDDAVAWFNLGYAYSRLNDLQQAEQMYARTVELKPEFVDRAYFNLALVQEKLGKPDDCIRNLELAIAANPKNQTAKKILSQKKR